MDISVEQVLHFVNERLRGVKIAGQEAEASTLA
jgi:hypothetical protein